MAKFLIGFLNLIIKALGSVLSLIFSILPPSPFGVIDNSAVQEHLAGLAWIIPFTQIIVILEAWTAAIIIYYLYQIVLRWVKAIE